MQLEALGLTFLLFYFAFTNIQILFPFNFPYFDNSGIFQNFMKC